MEDVRPNSLIQSLARGVMLLEHLADAGEGLSLHEAAQALGVGPSTAHNLLRTLAAHGFVERTSRPARYRLGAGLFDLVHRHEQRSLLRQGEVVLREVFDQLGGGVPVVLAEPLGGAVAVTRELSPERPGVIQRPRDRLMPIYTSASGLLLQAYWTSRQRAELRRRFPFAEHGQSCWGDLDELEAFLQEVRRLGYARPPGELRVAVPIFWPHGQFAAALGVYAPDADRAREAEIIRCLKCAADRLNAPARAGQQAPPSRTPEPE